MAPPRETILDILLFLHRFGAESKRLICREWSRIVADNDASWHDKIHLEDVSRASLPTYRELDDVPVGPELKEDCYYDRKRCSYEASELIGLISRSDKVAKPMKVGSLAVSDYEMPFPCTDLCDFHVPSAAGNADVSHTNHRITLRHHVSAEDLNRFLRENISASLYAFTRFTHFDFISQFLLEPACLNAEFVFMDFASVGFPSSGVLDESLVEYCFKESTCQARSVQMLGYSTTHTLLSSIIEKFVHSDSTAFFPLGIWIFGAAIKPQDLHLENAPCIPICFTDANGKSECHVYVVRNVRTNDCLSIRTHACNIRLKKLAPDHKLLDVIL